VLENLNLPFVASTWKVLCVFVLELIVLDLTLVRWLKLGKVAWKRVDYVWLGFAALGLIGAVAQARQFVAAALLSESDSRMAVAFNDVRSEINFYSESAAVCRTFVRSEWSPPEEEFRRVQHEYDQSCNWFKQARSRILQVQPSPPEEIRWEQLSQPPDVGDPSLKGMIKGFRQVVDTYNALVKKHDEFEENTKRTGLERTLTVITPILLSLALALRITKVTGEITSTS
jgi:hypothetical protein